MSSRNECKKMLLATFILFALVGCKKGSPPISNSPEEEPPPPPPAFTARDTTSLPLSKQLRDSFIAVEFTVSTKLSALPKDLRTKLYEVIDGQKIASSNEKYNPTDVVIDPAIPHRQLILAGVDSNIAFIYYEHGGIGHHQHLLIFTKGHDGAYALKANVYLNGLPGPSIKAIKILLSKNQFREASEA